MKLETEDGIEHISKQIGEDKKGTLHGVYQKKIELF